MYRLKNIKNKLPSFALEIQGYLKDLGILGIAQNLSADHVGLRLKSEEDVLAIKAELLKIGKIISSAIVNGREILIFELNQPLVVGSWTVPCIELPFPKTDHPYKDGLEHIEFVIPPQAETLAEMRKNFTRLFPVFDTEDLKNKGQYRESIPSTESDQLPNPTIELEKRVGLKIKFHSNSIKNIVG